MADDSRPREPATLRRCVLAVAVLHDVDVIPCEGGVALTAHPADRQEAPLVGWGEVEEAVGVGDPDSAGARARLARWLRLRTEIAALPADAVVSRVRILGLARDHVLHPGADWVIQTVPGGVLDLGFGLVGVDGDFDTIQPLPAPLRRYAALDPAGWLVPAQAHLEHAGSLAAERLTKERPVLRGVGPVDVVTLLGAATFRAELVAESGGMRTVAVPMRTRGWTDLRRVDPAFVLAAAAAVDPEQMGFPRPLLVTRDEVTMTAEGGDPLRSALDK